MRLLAKASLISLCSMSTVPAFADDISQYTNQQTATATQNILQTLNHLGKYLGFDLAQFPPQGNPQLQASSDLMDAKTLQSIQTGAYIALLGAMPVNTFSQSLMQFIPSNIAGASAINNLSNAVFTKQNFRTPQATQTAQSGNPQGTVTINPLIDQLPYQYDPVNQAVVNTLGTPDDDFCTVNKAQGCLSKQLVSTYVVGSLPQPNQLYSPNYLQQFFSQLNSNSLTGPLMYSTESTGSGSTSPQAGLTAESQAQQAANFIRYASGAVSPISIPSSSYNDLYAQMQSNSSSPQQQKQAEFTLSNYMSKLRTFAAQNSVGLSNLYFIMSKRMPQTVPETNQNTSQALSEFNMATWRLFNADKSVNTQWINQLNNASPATLQKEIATLLAEMNYQMYLDRQIQERILLTNTIMLMQNTRAAEPTANFSSSPSTTTQQSQ